MEWCFRRCELFGLAVFVLAIFAESAIAADGVSHEKMLHAVNTIRQQHKVAPLALHPKLQMMAREQSRRMARSGRMSHRVGWFNGFQTRLRRAGFRGLAAENIAKGHQDLERVLQTWMNSRGHRRNMLHPRMRYIGMALVHGRGQNYWTMVLGGEPL